MTEPRDESLERLLRQSVRRSGDAGATPSCLDAETMAAWLDGGLAGAELAAAEAHAATCEHCRALVAGIVRHQPPAALTASAEPAVPDGLRPRGRFGWIAPLGVAAVIALAIWIPRRTPSIEPELTLSMAPPPAASPQPELQPAAPPPLESARIGGVQTPPKSEPVRVQTASSAASVEALPQAMPSPPPPAPPAPTLKPEPIAEPAAAAPPAIRQSLDRMAELVAAQPVVTFQASTLPAGAAAFTADTAGRGAAARGAGGRGGRGAAPAGAPAFRTAAPVEPSRPPQWRVLATGAVERSNPSGAPWERIVFQPDAFITTGAAPSPFVCWLVGRSGAVLLSLNAQTFTRLPFPEAVDLVSVRAPDARMATVTTADGRRFTTTDGGQTWRLD